MAMTLSWSEWTKSPRTTRRDSKFLRFDIVATPFRRSHLYFSNKVRFCLHLQITAQNSFSDGFSIDLFSYVFHYFFSTFMLFVFLLLFVWWPWYILIYSVSPIQLWSHAAKHVPELDRGHNDLLWAGEPQSHIILYFQERKKKVFCFCFFVLFCFYFGRGAAVYV